MAVLALGTLAACTSDDPGDPPTSSPHTASATPTPSPTPTREATGPLARPDLSREDEATAEALARYYLDSYVHAYATGDLTEVRAFAHPECTFCADVVRRVEEYVAAGRYTSGGALEYSDVLATQVSERMFHVAMTVRQEQMSVHDATGSVIASYAATTYPAAVVVLYDSGEWQIRGVDTNAGQ